MADSCYQLVVNCNISGQFGSSIFHYHFDDVTFASTQLAAEGLIDAWDTHNRTAFRNCITNDVDILSIKSRKVSAVGGFEAIKLITTTNTGTRTGPIMVAGVNPLAVFLPVGTSKLRGKWFIPGINTADLVDGLIRSAYRTAAQTALNTMIANLTVTGGSSPVATPVIYSRDLNTWTPIIAAYISMTVGTQRRRQRPS